MEHCGKKFLDIAGRICNAVNIWNAGNIRFLGLRMERSSERRAEQRLRYRWPVRFAKNIKEKPLPGQIVDVSSRGMALLCHANKSCPQPDQLVTANFGVPRFDSHDSFDTVLFNRIGRVCRVDDLSNRVRRVAIQFAEPLFFKPGEQNISESDAQQRLEARSQSIAKAKEKAKAYAEAKARTEEKLKNEARARVEAQAKAESEAKARAQAEERAEAEAQARIEAEQQAKSNAEKDAKAHSEALARAEERARSLAEAKAQTEEKLKAEIEARYKAEAEWKAQAEEKVRAFAEAKARAEERAKTEAQATAKTQAKAKAEARARARAEKKAGTEAEKRAKLEAEVQEKVKSHADQIAKVKAETAEAISKVKAEAADEVSSIKAEFSERLRTYSEAKTRVEKKAISPDRTGRSKRSGLLQRVEMTVTNEAIGMMWILILSVAATIFLLLCHRQIPGT